MTDSPSSNTTPIWVAVITVSGSLLSVILVNADKWLPKHDSSAVAATSAAAASPVQPGPATNQTSPTTGPQTPVAVTEASASLGTPAQRTAAPAVSAQPSQGDDSPRTSSDGDSSALEANAENRVRQYFAAWSNSDDPDGSSIARFYARSVNFYGKQRSLQDIMGDKQQFARRWPSRSYVIKPNSLQTECTQDTGACKVFGKIDWRASSDSRSIGSSGTATFMLVLNGNVIVAENGHVLSRN